MSNTQRILEHLINDKSHSITSMEAFQNFGVTRLSAVIFDLRKAGHCIRSLTEESQNRYGKTVHYSRYILEENIANN